MTNEVAWNNDLIDILTEKLENNFPDVQIFKGKVLKDIFLNTAQKSGEQKIQFGFVDQDIVFYDSVLDIAQFNEMGSISIHNNNIDEERKDKIVIPKLICELKYDGINSHGLITYSDYASDIKSIFPECKYWLIMRYRKNSSENKLKRHGKYFDKILYFDEGKSDGNYSKGDFLAQIEKSSDLTKIFEEFLEEIKKALTTPKTKFIK